MGGTAGFSSSSGGLASTGGRGSGGLAAGGNAGSGAMTAGRSTGAGASTSSRSSYQLSASQAASYTLANILKAWTPSYSQ